MRIAILSSFYPLRGGIAQFNACLYAELGRAHEVAAFNFKRQYPSILFPGKTQYVTETDEAVPVSSRALTDTVNPFSWIRTAREIRKWKPDILIMRYWMPFFAPCLGFIARHCGRGCRKIAIIDNLVPHEKRPGDKLLSRYFLNSVGGCISLCAEVGKDIRMLRPDMPVMAGYHPLYSHFGEKLDRGYAEKKLGLEPGKKNLLFFGLIRQYKGLDILIDAFSNLPDDYQLIIAGEPYGPFDKYREMIERSGAKDRIHTFLSYIRDSEVKDYFSAADLVVLPYRSATQSGVSSVAYHFGVPMAVTDVGGLRETIGERGTGLIAERAEASLVAEQIVHFFSSPELRESLENNIAAERERLSWSNFCKDLINFANTL